MSHTIRAKAKLSSRVRRIRGQVEALERALSDEHGCAEVLQQIAAVRGAVNGLMLQVLQEHIETHLGVAGIATDVPRREAAEELIEVVRTYLK